MLPFQYLEERLIKIGEEFKQMELVDTEDSEQRMYDLYIIDCMNKGLTPTIRDFVVWKQEEYPEDSDD